MAPRVTGSSGQKRSLAGGLHPFVIPAVAIASMDATWMLLSSSANVPLDSPDGKIASITSRAATVGQAMRRYSASRRPA